MMSGLRVGDPADRDHRHRTPCRTTSTTSGAGLHPVRDDEGARIVLGGTDTASRPRLVCPADAVRRRDQRDAHRPGGDLRPGADRLTYTDEDDAIRIANDSDYGLAGSVWTADVAHGLEIAEQVRTGTYGINMYMLDTSARSAASSSPASDASSAPRACPSTSNCSRR